MVVCRAVYLTVPLSANKDRVNGRQKIVYSFKSTDGEKKGGLLERVPEKEVGGMCAFCFPLCVSKHMLAWVYLWPPGF